MPDVKDSPNAKAEQKVKREAEDAKEVCVKREKAEVAVEVLEVASWLRNEIQNVKIPPRTVDHPCLFQHGRCPFNNCPLSNVDGSICLNGSNCRIRACELSHNIAAVNDPTLLHDWWAQYNSEHGDDSFYYKDSQYKHLPWVPKRALTTTITSDYTNYMLAKDVGVSGAKSFVVLSSEVVPYLIQNTPPAERTFYSVVPPATSVDIYLDVDQQVSAEEATDIETQTTNKQALVKYVTDRLRSELAASELDIEHFVVLDSSTAVKRSFHVHIKLTDFVFADSQLLKNAVQYWFPPSDPQNAVVDISVYSQYSCFRMPLCVKKGRENALRQLTSEGDLEYNNIDLVKHCLITVSREELERKVVINKWPIGPAWSTVEEESQVTRTEALRNVQMIVPTCIKNSCCEWSGSYESKPMLKPVSDTQESLLETYSSQYREWCHTYQGALAERDMSRTVILNRTQYSSSEYLAVPQEAILPLALSDEGSAYFVCTDPVKEHDLVVPILITRTASDVASSTSSLQNGVLTSVIPLVVDKLKDLNTHLSTLVVLASPSSDDTESLLVIFGRTANDVSFSCLESLKEFLASIIPEYLLCFDRFEKNGHLQIPVPWSGQRLFTPVVIPRSEKIDSQHQPWLSFQKKEGIMVEEIIEKCLGGSQAISRFVIKKGAELQPVLPVRTLTQPLEESVSNMVHFVIRSLCVAYSLLSSTDLHVTRSGKFQTAFAVRISSGSCYCLIANRSHKNTKPNILLRRESIHVKCFSNDCQGETKQFPWPIETEGAKAVLFS